MQYMRRKGFEHLYEPLLLPIEKPMRKFSKSEAQHFFNWYISNIPERIRYLARHCGLPEYVDSASYDWNTSSLIKIWKWFLRYADVEQDPITGTQGLSVMTHYVIRDIGMYIGEMFVNVYPQLSWGFYTKPKSDVFVNEPVLFGFVDRSYVPPFQMPFEPINMVCVKALNILDKSQSVSDLYDLFQHWTKFTN